MKRQRLIDSEPPPEEPAAEEPQQEYIPAEEKNFLGNTRQTRFLDHVAGYDGSEDPPEFVDDELDLEAQRANERYTNDMPQDAAEYARRGFMLQGEMIPTLEGLANLLRVTSPTLRRWGERHPVFGQALEYLKGEQKRRLINHGLSGAYHPAMSRLLLSAEHGVTEKQDFTSSDGTMSPTRIEREIVHPTPPALDHDSTEDTDSGDI